MAASLPDQVMDIVVARVTALVPQTYPGRRFHENRRGGNVDLEVMRRDGSFDRLIETSVSGSMTLRKPYGGTLGGEYSESVILEVGYLDRGDWRGLKRRMKQDQQDIISNLETPGISWPSEMVNFSMDSGNSGWEMLGDQHGAAVMSIGVSIIYDVT